MTLTRGGPTNGGRSPGILLLGPLPDSAGTASTLRELRSGALSCDPNLPVLTLGRDDALAQLRAYEGGSDHHLRTDASYVLLRAVLATMARRIEAARFRPQTLQVGPISIDVASRQVRVDKSPVTLTAKEFELLHALAGDPERVFTKQELLSDIWGYQDPGTTRTLDSHACRLRRRIAEAGRPGHVRNHWGVGYRLKP